MPALQPKAPIIIPEKQEEQDEKELLDILDGVQEKEAARIVKENIAEQKHHKKKQKEHWDRKKKCKGKCERCKKHINPKDRRTLHCPECGKIVAAEKAKLWWRPPLDQEETQEKLRPFLRLDYNLKEACLECELSYGTIQEKLKTWDGFADFVERHRNFASLKAKKVLVKNLMDGSEKSIDTAKWLLQRRKRDEYGDSLDVKSKSSIDISLPPQQQEALETLLLLRTWPQKKSSNFSKTSKSE